jgi:hypothetical protein
MYNQSIRNDVLEPVHVVHSDREVYTTRCLHPVDIVGSNPTRDISFIIPFYLQSVPVHSAV